MYHLQRIHMLLCYTLIQFGLNLLFSPSKLYTHAHTHARPHNYQLLNALK